ncbi:hypothetical protein B0T24DRAFT_518643 [Lasiosphaeria ovina]|uniref:Uncharacterized protein n=1 Tax=Lasiosphaeria ovina TaxID=92902 RepID=A0AAE0NNP4_9PEZI|nr:hypothetical protein B0T24DRAFT_518643 [Lasiosphaeria ovina]
MAATRSDRSLVLIGSGPGIGVSVASLFAAKRFGKVVLIARRAEQLAADKRAVEAAAVTEGLLQVRVKTYAVDVVDTPALLAALDDAEAAFGKPEVVFFNAARVLPSALLEHDVAEIEYDLKITVSALYAVAKREVPGLAALARADATARPALMVTSSTLPQQPIPQVFSLSLAKAAQRNLVQSLVLTYAPGVHIGLVVVDGPVAPTHETRNPANIAAKTWEWFAQARESPSFEVEIA